MATYVGAALILACGVGAAVRGQAPAIATVNLTRGWATFGQALPQGIARDGLRVGTLVTQTDVKNRWPDGSIRFATVTVNAPANGAYPLTPAIPTVGGFAPRIPDVSVVLTIAGTKYTALLPRTPSRELWLSGPLVFEGRSVVAPVWSSITHPFLRVIFDSRVYNDGRARIDVIVENVLDKAGATTVTYDVAIVVDDQPAFMKSAVQHFYLTRWRRVFDVRATPWATVTPDIVSFSQSRALPSFLSLVSNEVNSAAGPEFDILHAGALNVNMPEHGGRPEVAPYPDWVARYLVHKNQTQRRFVLANGDLSGSWPVHVREPEGGPHSGVGVERVVSLDQRPRIWFDGRARDDRFDYIKGGPMPLREYGSVTPGPGQSPLIPDNAHQPSLAYVPYLLTGDHYYAEEMAFWANYGMLRTYPADGVRGSHGILAANEVRGYGWSLRNMADAAAYYPDSSEVHTYLGRKIVANLQWLDDYANSQDPAANPFRVLWANKRPEPGFIALWEQAYLAYAIDRANKQGFAGGLAHRDAIAGLQLRLFTSEPAYPRAEAAPYVLGVGTPGLIRFTYYPTMAQLWRATKGNEREFAGYYGPEARLSLMIGVERGWPGARAAYDYLWPFLAVQPASGGVPDLAKRAGWAVNLQ